MNESAIKIRISGLSHEGRGIAHNEGKTIFVSGALPGEEVTFRYTKRHRQYDEAQAIEILESSVDRVIPQCQHFDICGGCSVQHLNPQVQIAHKQQALLELLERVGKLKPKKMLPPLTGPHWGYRTKARLGLKYVIKKQKLLLGLINA